MRFALRDFLVLGALVSLAVTALGCKTTSAVAAPASVDMATEDADAVVSATDATAASDTAPSSSDTASAELAGVDTAGDPCSGAVANWHSDPKKLVRNLHQTWQHDPATTMTVTWTTEVTDLTKYVPRVVAATVATGCKLGQALLSKGVTTTGKGSLYAAIVGSDEVKVVAWTVELTDLQPDTDYVFRAGSYATLDAVTGIPTAAELSDVAHFRTAPAKGDRKPMPFVVAGDSRGGAAKIKANSKMYTALPALAWFFSGDMNPTGVQEEWNDWFDAMALILNDHPLMPVQGNHEIFAEIYYNQFALPAMPGIASAYVEHGWSVNVGNVHFVGLDSGSEEACIDQTPWLTGDLKKAQADPDIDWTLVQFHHGTYSASLHGSTTYVQKQWVPLFEKYGVDLVLNGHDHNYERSVPILADKPTTQDKGITYVVAGGFFAPAYANGKQWWTAVSHHGDKNNFVQLLVDGKKLKLTALSGDGKTELDKFELTR